MLAVRHHDRVVVVERLAGEFALDALIRDRADCHVHHARAQFVQVGRVAPAVDAHQHVGVLDAKALDHRGQQHMRRAAGGADAHHAVARAQHLRHFLAGLAGLGGDQPRAPQEGIAVARQHHAAGGAGQQRHMQLLFQLADALGQCRCRHVARTGPGADAAVLGHGDEVLDLAQTHGFGSTQTTHWAHSIAAFRRVRDNPRVLTIGLHRGSFSICRDAPCQRMIAPHRRKPPAAPASSRSGIA
ncbi:hypothetical protein D3C72_1422940 [compost metagenome]